MKMARVAAPRRTCDMAMESSRRECVMINDCRGKSAFCRGVCEAPEVALAPGGGPDLGNGRKIQRHHFSRVCRVEDDALLRSQIPWLNDTDCVGAKGQVFNFHRTFTAADAIDRDECIGRIRLYHQRAFYFFRGWNGLRLTRDGAGCLRRSTRRNEPHRRHL